MEDTKKTCSRCKRSLLISDFNWRNKKAKKRQYHCKICQRTLQNAFYRKTPEYQDSVKTAAKARKLKIKRQYLQYLKKQQCIDCNESNHVVLTHDHRDPAIKTECVSIMVQRSNGWKNIQAEIAKCDVVCFNCHAIRTAKTQKWYENW